jgi:toxin ParE1/3/4
MPYRVSSNAQEDLDRIFVYWAKRVSVETADRLIDRITDRFWLLGEYPRAGKLCDHIDHGVRSFPAGKYIIYYRTTRRATEILHVFHGSRNQRTALNPNG